LARRRGTADQQRYFAEDDVSWDTREDAFEELVIKLAGTLPGVHKVRGEIE
jgi:hypothetical protein